MNDPFQIWMLIIAILLIASLSVLNTILLVKAMGDIEKFGRLLLKVSRKLQSDAS